MEQSDQKAVHVSGESAIVKIKAGTLEGTVCLQGSGHHYLELSLLDASNEPRAMIFSLNDLLRLKHLFTVAVDAMTEVDGDRLTKDQ